MKLLLSNIPCFHFWLLLSCFRLDNCKDNICLLRGSSFHKKEKLARSGRTCLDCKRDLGADEFEKNKLLHLILISQISTFHFLFDNCITLIMISILI